MNESEIRAGVIAAILSIAPEVDADALDPARRILSIAPEVDADALDPARRLRDQVDLDSMDWLNVIVSLHERFGIEIPEADYAQLNTLNAIVSYLDSRMR